MTDQNTSCRLARTAWHLSSGRVVDMQYEDFLRAKVKMAQFNGFDVSDDDLSPCLYPHQRDIVKWAVQGGKRAIFAKFGLGKSVMQCEWMRLITKDRNGRGLVICPLGVRHEIVRDAKLVGLDLRFIRRDEEISDDHQHYITNYESVRDGKLSPDKFEAVSLDEASVLRSYGSKTYQEFLPMFDKVPFKLVNTATPSPNRFKELIHYAGFLGVMDTGQALAQPLTSRVLTPAGWRSMGDIKAGDRVIASNGKPTEVLGVYPQGVKDIFRVTFSDGSYTRCTSEHLWLTRTQYERNAAAKFAKRNPGADASHYWTVKDTASLADTLKCASTGSKNHQIPLVSPVQFESQLIDVHPYLLGYLIGDGCLRETSITVTTADDWVVQHLSDLVAKYGLAVRKVQQDRKDGKPNYDYRISAGAAGYTGRGHRSNAVLNGLRKYDLIGKRSWEKRIPKEYLYNDPEIRLALLQGLMDADGTIANDRKNRTTRLTTTSNGLADDVVFIVQSLGGTAQIRERVGRTPKGGRGRTQYVVTLRLPNGINPFRLPRKANLVVDRVKYEPRRYIVSVEPDGQEEAQCIGVADAEHLYVTDNFIVTHNTRFFQRDSTQANNLTLYPHKEQEFWLWISSWAVFIQRPSDLGYSDEGYTLPDMEVVYHEVPSDYEKAGMDRDGQVLMFQDPAMGLAAAAREKRDSIPDRVEVARQLVEESPDDHFVIWHDLERERHAIQQAIPEAVSVWGSQDLDQREQRIVDFGDGKYRILSTKPIIAGSGCNFQRHCHRAIFAGVGFKFNDFIQACHRIQRFQQTKPVRIDIIYTEAEREVLKTLQKKWAQHDEMVEKMSEIIKEYGLNQLAMKDVLTRSIGCERIEVSSDRFTVANNDCVAEAKLQAENSVDLIVTSIPFANHYEYSASYNDFGHTASNEHFWQQMDYLTPELLRMLNPGRVYACHVKDRILFGNATGKGVPTVSPFHCEAIMHGIKHGFDYLGMITVVTDVVSENNQTYRLGWSEQCKDGTKMGVGSPEYIVLFRKPQTDRTRGYADVPVVKSKDKYTRARWQVDAHAFWRSNGNRQITSEELAALGPAKLANMFTQYSLEHIYNYEFHVKIGEELDERGALPSTFMSLAPGSHSDSVWHDVTRMLTLNGSQTRRNVEKHICPLQFDIIDRLIDRYSNSDELVYDPFCGIGSVPYRAILKGRRGGGSELNPGYFMDQVHYLKAAEREFGMPDLFAALEVAA